ncbi:hypothetical protein BGP_0694 [Beggiatoa sp. PS]|nr:hypothetical protein BGP_0694 [Beggiatoa sp. PS]
MLERDLTDEDRMIYKLIVHRNLIGWFIKKCAEQNIQCERTTGNDSHGDIVINKEDESQVKELIRTMQKQYNPE